MLKAIIALSLSGELQNRNWSLENLSTLMVEPREVAETVSFGWITIVLLHQELLPTARSYVAIQVSPSGEISEIPA